jgi:hypothetical protein
LLVGLGEICTVEHTCGSGDRLRECPKWIMHRRGPAKQFTGMGARCCQNTRPKTRSARRGCRAGTGALRDLFYFYLVARGICFTKGGSFALSIIL